MMLTMLSIRQEADLQPFNTYGLAGRAAHLAIVSSPAELREAQAFAGERRLPVAVIGAGSNLILGEDRYPGLVVVVRLMGLVRDDAHRVEAGAGEALESLVHFAQREGLCGIERLAGIPGTVGGAVYGNAGAFGEQIGDRVSGVQLLAPSGEIREVSGPDCRFAYRDSAFRLGERPGVIISALLQLRPEGPETIQAAIDETLAARRGKHPAGASCGSFFKNVEVDRLAPAVRRPLEPWVVFGKIPAGRLIQEVGAKGLRVGGVHTSDQHCNFLINDGEATVADIKLLAQEIKTRVRDQFGVELEEEVRYL